MKTVVAVAMGFVSGFLIYMMVALLTIDVSGSSTSRPSLILLLFVGGWILSTWLLMRGAASVSAVFRRGFLLGAAEWLCMAMVGVLFSGRMVSSTMSGTAGSEAVSAGAAVGGGLMAALTGGLSVFMAVVCLIGFAIAYFTGREMSDRTLTPTRKCPECAEMIQPDAKKCRYCGAVLSSEPAAV
jgi:hypothetical protein